MQYGLDVPTTGAYADARVQAQLAAEAEEAGWDGFFIWDVLLGDQAAIDPWIALTAIALQTSRIKLGTLVTPLPRDRPWLVARRFADLDHLSGGRVIAIVGSGHSERDFSAFGEEGDLATRAAKLDEGLAIIAGLWTTEHFSYAGEHYTLEDVTFHSRPLQAPRIPIWIVAGWPRRRPVRRAVGWDGLCLKSVHQDTRKWLTLDDFRACLAYVQAQEPQHMPFEVVMSGETPDERDRAIAMVRDFEAAGATWWIEEGLGWTLDEFRERVRRGPPRD